MQPRHDGGTKLRLWVRLLTRERRAGREEKKTCSGNVCSIRFKLGRMASRRWACAAQRVPACILPYPTYLLTYAVPTRLLVDSEQTPPARAEVASNASMHVRTPPCEINICTAIAILLAETCYTYIHILLVMNAV